MTVSSTSEMRPNRSAGSTTNTWVEIGSDPGTLRSMACQPGGRCSSTCASTTPPRPIGMVRTWSPTRMTSSRSSEGTLRKLRQLRTFAARSEAGASGFASTTLASTRTQPGEP